MFDRRNEDLFILSCARMLRHDLGHDFNVLTESVVAFISLLIFVGLGYVVNAVACMRFMFCLICASVAFFCTLMGGTCICCC